MTFPPCKIVPFFILVVTKPNLQYYVKKMTKVNTVWQGFDLLPQRTNARCQLTLLSAVKRTVLWLLVVGSRGTGNSKTARGEVLKIITMIVYCKDALSSEVNLEVLWSSVEYNIPLNCAPTYGKLRSTVAHS